MRFAASGTERGGWGGWWSEGVEKHFESRRAGNEGNKCRAEGQLWENDDDTIMSRVGLCLREDPVSMRQEELFGAGGRIYGEIGGYLYLNFVNKWKDGRGSIEGRTEASRDSRGVGGGNKGVISWNCSGLLFFYQRFRPYKVQDLECKNLSPAENSTFYLLWAHCSSDKNSKFSPSVVCREWILSLLLKKMKRKKTWFKKPIKFFFVTY